ncbi:hypothetical protein C8J57DRAFT_1070616 [Mycena rebaudengoi]|nr:hypothetical protein C8J57DRAFT_1070616 [Mycena rebaudengoi]
MVPQLDPEKPLPHGAEDIGDGYVLLRARDEFHQSIDGPYGAAIREFLEEETGEKCKADWIPRVARWARVGLPTGQIVQFFFQATINDTRELSVALVSVYSDPDPDLLLASFQTVLLCEYLGEDALQVIDIKSIKASVGMIPYPDEDGLYFVAEKMGLDVGDMGGEEEDMDE